MTDVVGQGDDREPLRRPGPGLLAVAIVAVLAVAFWRLAGDSTRQPVERTARPTGSASATPAPTPSARPFPTALAARPAPGLPTDLRQLDLVLWGFDVARWDAGSGGTTYFTGWERGAGPMVQSVATAAGAVAFVVGDAASSDSTKVPIAYVVPPTRTSAVRLGPAEQVLPGSDSRTFWVRGTATVRQYGLHGEPHGPTYDVPEGVALWAAVGDRFVVNDGRVALWRPSTGERSPLPDVEGEFVAANDGLIAVVSGCLRGRTCAVTFVDATSGVRSTVRLPKLSLPVVSGDLSGDRLALAGAPRLGGSTTRVAVVDRSRGTVTYFDTPAPLPQLAWADTATLVLAGSQELHYWRVGLRAPRPLARQLGPAFWRVAAARQAPG